MWFVEGGGGGRGTKRRTIQVSRMVRWAGRMENQDMVVDEDVVVSGSGTLSHDLLYVDWPICDTNWSSWIPNDPD